MSDFLVGIIGLDAMGGALTRRFDEMGVGHSVTDLSSRMIQAHLAEGGAAPAGSPYDLAQMCNLIFIAETADETLRESILGPTGLYHMLKPGAIVVDMSDVSPQTGQELARRLVSKGGLWIEATPVGTPSDIRAGSLTLLAAGQTEAIERVTPVLLTFASKILRLGELGSGTIAKALGATLSASALVLYTEFMIAAQKLGLDAAGLIEALPYLAPGAGTPPALLTQEVLPGSYSSGVSQRQAVADIRKLLEAARGVEAPLPLASLVQAAYTSAAYVQGASGDQLDVARWMAANAGVEFSAPARKA